MACLVGSSPTTYALEGHCSKITELQAHLNFNCKFKIIKHLTGVKNNFSISRHCKKNYKQKVDTILIICSPVNESIHRFFAIHILLANEEPSQAFL